MDLTLKNGLGCSPLWVAAGYDRVDCLEYLVDKLFERGGVEGLEAALLDANNTGDTPFLAAASRGNVAACRALLDSVEKSGAKNAEKLEGIEDLDSFSWDVKRRMLRTANDAGDTPLKVAVASGQGEEMLRLLLEADESCDEHATTTTGSSNGPDGDDARRKCIDRKNGAGLSPLIVACERNLPSAVGLLVDHGADPSVTDSRGRNALAIASFCGCADVVERLLGDPRLGARLLDGGDDGGCTPLWLAARTGNLAVVELLAGAGADASIADANEGLTPEGAAVKFKKERVVEYFAARR